MSVLVLNIVPEGILLGTDRLLRWGPDPMTRLVGHTEGPKIIRWPNRRALLGFIGMADLGRRVDRNSTYEWLTDFIGANHDFDSLTELANELCRSVQSQYLDDGWNGEEDEVLVIELAGFQRADDGESVPQVWHIANTHGISDAGTYNAIDSNFGLSDEFASRFSPLSAADVKIRLAENPFWIHQTGDFENFNSLCRSLDEFYDRRLRSFGIDPAVEPPEYDRLHEFESRVRMKILTYGSFNDSFETPVSRSIGGGADVFFLEWPDD